MDLVLLNERCSKAESYLFNILTLASSEFREDRLRWKAAQRCISEERRREQERLELIRKQETAEISRRVQERKNRIVLCESRCDDQKEFCSNKKSHYKELG